MGVEKHVQWNHKDLVREILSEGIRYTLTNTWGEKKEGKLKQLNNIIANSSVLDRETWAWGGHYVMSNNYALLLGVIVALSYV